ncbi:MAG: type I restriction enzyme HsdR N-terminal domain-containing protein, partial [Lutibacter sp.]
NPHIIVECKAPSIKISQDTFDQIARYNLKLEANYLIVTNGLTHFYSFMDLKNETYVFMENIPEYEHYL